MKFLIWKGLLLAEQQFLLWFWKRRGRVKNHPLYNDCHHNHDDHLWRAVVPILITCTATPTIALPPLRLDTPPCQDHCDQDIYAPLYSIALMVDDHLARIIVSKVADKRCLWCWLITNYGGDGNWCCYHSATIQFYKNAKSTWTIESLKGLSAFSIVSESLKANTMKRFTNSLRHVYRNPQDTPGHVLCLWLFSPGKGKYFTWDWIFFILSLLSILSRYALLLYLVDQAKGFTWCL